MAKLEIDTKNLINIIANKTGLKISVIESIIKLLDEGNTVPFIARYRKEVTEGATDEQLRDFNDIYTYTINLENRKQDILRLIDEKGLLTDELRDAIIKSETLARLEDIYRPFKEKKQTKSTIAKAKGLQTLAELLKLAQISKEDFEQEAHKYIVDTGDIKTSVASAKEAIQGAMDILAEDISDHADLRDEIRKRLNSNVILQTKASKTFEANGVYKIYGEYNKKFSDIPNYAYLAINRAEDEKQISVSFVDHNGGSISKSEYISNITAKYFVPKNSNTSVEYIYIAIEDGLDRLLMPSITREIRSDKKQRADEAAIKMFGENMKQLLLTSPIRGKTVLGLDPGYRTGCKIAIVDPTGKFLHKDVVYISLPNTDHSRDEVKLLEMIKKFSVDLVVIGNGTASRESSKYISDLIKNHKLDCKYIVVNEAGASVYSASKLAQSEYPDLDVTVRGAISIAHRAQDSLAELTKIDPKSIGVGQYQHDVDQKLLATKLDEKVQDTVNTVGVNVNTASWTLLKYISGLSETIAKNITIHRDTNGPFTSKSQLKKVKGLGPKAYEQCVGFLRIPDGSEALDATGIHPDNYKQTYDILNNEFGIIVDKKHSLTLPISEDTLKSKNPSDIYTKYDIGLETLQDILAELSRPGLDPREELDEAAFESNVLELGDLKIGDIVQGVVRNITDFGVFVDIGLHNDGFIHKSQLADIYVSHPINVVSLGQNIKAKVIEIDLDREKVSLNSKEFVDISGISRPTQSRPKQENKPKIIDNKSSDNNTGMKSNINWK